MATQLGYASGLLLIAPLGDVVARKPLILALAAGLTVALAAAALATGVPMLIGASFLIGLMATLVQQIVPMAAHLAPEDRRGRVVGTVMSGLLFGVLGGRVAAGFLGALVGWRGVFAAGAGTMVLLGLVLWWRLPSLPPATKEPYGRLLRSVFAMAKKHPALRASAIQGSLLFAAFSLFWVTLTPFLASPAFNLGSKAAGLFGLIGAVGTLVAPLSGRSADKHGSGPVITVAVAIVLASFAIFGAFGRTLVGLAIGTVVLDAGIQAALIANQARIFALEPPARSRINAFFMTVYFLGGAMGSLAAAGAWAWFGWMGAVAAGSLFALGSGLAHWLSSRD